MRREQFTLDVSNVDWVDDDEDPAIPTVSIEFTGSPAVLHERLTDLEGETLRADETDASYRLQGPIDEETPGVVSVTNRVTGAFVLELNAEAADVLRFVRAARGYAEAVPDDDDARYRVEITVDGEPFVSYEKGTFLVYDHNGNLLRQRSLIPGGVEL